MMSKARASVLLAALLVGCKEPTPEQVEFQKRFDREAVLVRTCGTDPGIASAVPLKVYRFEQQLWFNELGVWRRVDGKVDNVCDLLDIDSGHKPPPPILPPGWSIGR